MADGDSPNSDLVQENLKVTKPSYYTALLGKNKDRRATNSTFSQQPHVEVDLEEVQYKPISQYQGKLAVLFPLEEKSVLVDKLKFVLIGKFSHGRPSWQKIKDFFNVIKLVGTYNISFFDQKHIFIECSNLADYNRIWLRLKWFVDGCPMRILKWVPEFSPLIESPIVPVWIRMEGIPLYMFEEMPLRQISNVIGKPLRIDSRNLNRSMLNIASVCVALDISKSLVESFWVCFEDKSTGLVQEPFCVSVCYDYIPPYCTVCSHVGHKKDLCKRFQPPNITQEENQEQLKIKQPSSQTNDVLNPKVQGKKTVWIAVNSKTGPLDNGIRIRHEEEVQTRREVSPIKNGASSNVIISDNVARIVETQMHKEVNPQAGQNGRNGEQDWQLVVSKKHKNKRGKAPTVLKADSEQNQDLCLPDQLVGSKEKIEDTGQKLQHIMQEHGEFCFDETVTRKDKGKGIAQIEMDQQIVSRSQDGASSSVKIADLSAQEAAAQERTETIPIEAVVNDVVTYKNTFSALCSAQEVSTEAMSSEVTAVRENNLEMVVVNTADNAEYSKSTDVPTYETTLQLEKVKDAGAKSLHDTPLDIQITNTGHSIENGAVMTDTATVLAKEPELPNAQTDSEKGTIAGHYKPDTLQTEHSNEGAIVAWEDPRCVEHIAAVRKVDDAKEEPTPSATHLCLTPNQQHNKTRDPKLNAQATPYTQAIHKARINEGEDTISEPVTQEWQVVGKKKSKVQGVVTRAQAKASNNTWADKAEEEQIAEQEYKALMYSRNKLSMKILKLESRLMNCNLRDGTKRQLRAELDALTAEYNQHY